MMFKQKHIVFLLVIISLLFYHQVIAQTSPILKGSNIRPFTIGGNASISSQFYNANGIKNRQPSLLGEGTVNVNFSLFGISSGFNLLYSSDNSKLRQSMNKISFSGRWKSIQLSVGTVSPSMSKFGLNGASITGGDLVINPGIFYFEITGGQSKRAVQPDTTSGYRGASYKQMMFAAKIGLGNKGSTHFFISALYAKDDTNSLSNKPDKIKPQENITITPDFEIKLFNNHFHLRGEATVSAYTEDLHSSKLNISKVKIPSFITKIFQPRVSSRINYAANLETGLNFESVDFLLEYTRIQPGFYSLGTSQLRDDQQNFKINTQFRILNNRVMIGGNMSLAKNNLLGDRIVTQRTSNYGLNVNARISNKLNLNSSYTLMVNDVSPNSNFQDTLKNVILKRTQKAQTFLIQPTLIIQTGNIVNSISFSGSFLSIGNNIGNNSNTNQNFNSKTFTSNLSYSISSPSGLTFTLSGNFMSTKSNNTKNLNLGGNAAITYAFFNRKFPTSLNFGINNNSTKQENGSTNSQTKLRQVTLNLNMSYRLSKNNSFSFSARLLDNSSIQGTGYSFIESQARFSFSHRF